MRRVLQERPMHRTIEASVSLTRDVQNAKNESVRGSNSTASRRWAFISGARSKRSMTLNHD